MYTFRKIFLGKNILGLNVSQIVADNILGEVQVPGMERPRCKKTHFSMFPALWTKLVGPTDVYDLPPFSSIRSSQLSAQGTISHQRHQ
jgi:hypothetical protein